MTKINVEFAPGCFDNFEGTQDELDELINEVLELAESGKIFDQPNVILLDELSENEEDDLLTALSKQHRVLH